MPFLWSWYSHPLNRHVKAYFFWFLRGLPPEYQTPRKGFRNRSLSSQKIRCTCTIFISCLSIYFGSIFYAKVPNNSYLEVLYTLNIPKTIFYQYNIRPQISPSGSTYFKAIWRALYHFWWKYKTCNLKCKTEQIIAHIQRLKSKPKVKGKVRFVLFAQNHIICITI